MNEMNLEMSRGTELELEAYVKLKKPTYRQTAYLARKIVRETKGANNMVDDLIAMQVLRNMRTAMGV